jgi:hypothetical protein
MQKDPMPGLGLARGIPRSGQIKIHGADAFEGMRRAGALAAETRRGRRLTHTSRSLTRSRLIVVTGSPALPSRGNTCPAPEKLIAGLAVGDNPFAA